VVAQDLEAGLGDAVVLEDDSALLSLGEEADVSSEGVRLVAGLGAGLDVCGMSARLGRLRVEIYGEKCSKDQLAGCDEARQAHGIGLL
jgi:hypothetical protein